MSHFAKSETLQLRIDERRVISGLRLANAQVEARFPLLCRLVNRPGFPGGSIP